jgi:hypothetical protein
MKRHKSHSTVVNFKLCPAARIKVYNNIWIFYISIKKIRSSYIIYLYIY